MDSDLITVARTLAERGWLPLIEYDGLNGFELRMGPMLAREATEADLHLAAIKRTREINGTIQLGTRWVTLWVHDMEGIRMPNVYTQPAKQGDTLALLRCLLAASEASEKSKETTHA